MAQPMVVGPTRALLTTRDTASAGAHRRRPQAPPSAPPHLLTGHYLPSPPLPSQRPTPRPPPPSAPTDTGGVQRLGPSGSVPETGPPSEGTPGTGGAPGAGPPSGGVPDTGPPSGSEPGADHPSGGMPLGGMPGSGPSSEEQQEVLAAAAALVVEIASRGPGFMGSVAALMDPHQESMVGWKQPRAHRGVFPPRARGAPGVRRTSPCPWGGTQ